MGFFFKFYNVCGDEAKALLEMTVQASRSENFISATNVKTSKPQNPMTAFALCVVVWGRA
jgi:hypothetical protein